MRESGKDLSQRCPHCGASPGESCWDDLHPAGFFLEKDLASTYIEELRALPYDKRVDRLVADMKKILKG